MSSFINLFFVTIAAFYLALMYENAAIMLLAYLLAAFFVVSLFGVSFRVVMVKARLEIPVGISEPGKESMVRLVVTNGCPFPVRRIKALLSVEDKLNGKRTDSWMKLSAVSRGETALVGGLSLSGAGNYTVILKKLRVYDRTGLLHGDRKESSVADIQVLPALHEVPVQLTAVTRNFCGESDVYDGHRSGDDSSELFQIREYREGDQLRDIHWKLTAKQEELMVKEHALPKPCPVVLFLEFHPGKRSKKRERLIPYMEAAASLSFSIMDAGCPHYIVWYDSEEADLKRLRVEDEESLFYFIGMLMRISWEQPKEEPVQRYREKYQMEPYVWALSLDEELLLKKGEEILARFSEKNLEQSLSQIELLL